MADCNEERRSARRPCPRAPLFAAQAALILSSLTTVALAQTPPPSTLAPPWQRPTDTAGTQPASPPPPPGATTPIASAPRPSAGPPLVARVELVSDDTPVEVYVVTGTRELLQFVSVPTAPSPSTMGFGLGMPFGGGALIAPIGSTNYAPSELIEARTTVEQRRFLCTTPCAVSMPEGPLSLHLRTLGAALGTETVQLRPGATRFRVRTAATGLYTIGQALLWVGAGLAVTGASLIVQSQTGCGPGGCTPWPGALTTGAGVLSMAIGIPLVVLYSRRLEAIGARSVAVGPGVVRLAF